MKYLIANLKSNKTLDEIKTYKSELESLNISEKIKLIICPPAPYFVLLKNANYELGSQNVSKFASGPYTGEISAEQLKSLNVDYVLIGHSERKKYYNEKNEDFILKIKQCLNNNLKIIYFIGEKSKKTNPKVLYNEIKMQLENIFNNIEDKYHKNFIIAYEPNWSIGSKEPLDLEYIKQTVDFIKEYLKNNQNINIPIVYGGGINKTNFVNIFDLNNLDGFVIGESSLDTKCLQQFYNKYEQKS